MSVRLSSEQAVLRLSLGPAAALMELEEPRGEVGASQRGQPAPSETACLQAVLTLTLLSTMLCTQPHGSWVMKLLARAAG